MYGIFHVEIQHYIETQFGRDLWTATLKRAGLKNRIYMTVSTYLDSEVTALITAASELTGTPAETLFEDFGVSLAPSLMSTYAPLIDTKWTMADLVLNLEDAVYRMIRTRSPGAHPPRMKFERTGPRQLSLHYDSPRRMPALALGILKGIAAYYGEPVDVQTQTNLDGSVDFTITMVAEGSEQTADP